MTPTGWEDAQEPTDDDIRAAVLALLTDLRDTAPIAPPHDPCEVFAPEYHRLCGDFDQRRRAAFNPDQLALPLETKRRSA